MQQFNAEDVCAQNFFMEQKHSSTAKKKLKKKIGICSQMLPQNLATIRDERESGVQA